jgi:hypothetical protein
MIKIEITLYPRTTTLHYLDNLELSTDLDVNLLL